MDRTSIKRKKVQKLQQIDAFILCGGQGTRLRSVLPHEPKSLAPMKDRAFIDILIENLKAQGFTKIILGVGHLKDRIKDKYRDVPGVVISEEDAPLGTGGAIKNAEKLIASEDFLVANGDSIFRGLDAGTFYEFHKKQDALVSLALALPRAEKDFGGVLLDPDGRVRSFTKKNNLDEHIFMNGGVYFMKKNALELMPQGSFSLEHDFFPRLTQSSLYGFVHPGEVIDIGTPERYKHAKKVLT